MIKKSLVFPVVSLLTLFSLFYQSHAAYVSGTCLRLTATGMVYDAYDENTNGQVTLLQDFLIWKRLLTTDSGQATGYFGVKTLAAVRAYQASKGIQTTGNVGPLTKAAIETETCTSATTAQVNQNTITNNTGWGTTNQNTVTQGWATTGTTNQNTASNNTGWGTTQTQTQTTATNQGWGTVATTNQTGSQGWNTATNQNTTSNNTGWGTLSTSNPTTFSTGGQPTCSIVTLKSSYAKGETVYVGYYSTGATSVSWVPTSGLTGVATDVTLPPSGSAQFLAAQTGSYTLVLRPYSSSGLGGICTKVITITEPTLSSNPVLNFGSIATTGGTNTGVTTNTNTNTTTTTNSNTSSNTTSSNPSTSVSQANQQATPIVVNEPLPAPPTLSLSLKKSTLTYGEQWGELIWSASPPDVMCDRFKTIGNVTDWNGTTTSSGVYKFGGDETTTYTMTCYRFVTSTSTGNLLKSSATRSVTVTVPQTQGILRMRAGTGLGTFEAGDVYATKELALAECNKEFRDLTQVSSTSMSCTWNSQEIFSYKGIIPKPNFFIGANAPRYFPVPENSSRLLIANETEVFARFFAKTVNEWAGTTLTSLTFSVPPNTIKSLTVNGVTANVVDGKATLTGVNLPVPAGGVGLHFNVIAKMGCVGTTSGCVPANSDVWIKFTNYTYSYQYDSGLTGIKSGTGGSNVGSNNTSETHKIVSGLPKVSVAQPSLTRLTNYAGKVGEIKITAGAGGDIALIQIPITLTQRGYGAITPGSVELRNASGTSVVADVSTLNGSGTFVFSTPKVITKGTSETFSVYATFTGVNGPSGDNLVIFGLGDKTLFQWDDVTGNTLNLKGSVLRDWPTATSSVLLN